MHALAADDDGVKLAVVGVTNPGLAALVTVIGPGFGGWLHLDQVLAALLAVGRLLAPAGLKAGPTLVVIAGKTGPHGGLRVIRPAPVASEIPDGGAQVVRVTSHNSSRTGSTSASSSTSTPNMHLIAEEEEDDD